MHERLQLGRRRALMFNIDVGRRRTRQEKEKHSKIALKQSSVFCTLITLTTWTAYMHSVSHMCGQHAQSVLKYTWAFS